LRILPQPAILITHAGVKVLRQVEGQIQARDQFLHVRQVFQAMRGRQSGRQLEFDEFVERDEPYALALQARLSRGGKSDRLGFAVAGVVARSNDLNLDAGACVAESLRRTGKGRLIAAPRQTLSKNLQRFRRHEDVHSFGKPAIAVRDQRQAADQRVVQAVLVQLVDQTTQGLVNVSLVLEEFASLL
jgi:hypothetical protein